MEIESLKLILTDRDLNELIAKYVKLPAETVADLQVHITSGRLCLSGVYLGLVKLPFESRWELAVEQGRIVARLDKLKAGMIGLGIFKGLLLKAVAARSNLIQLVDHELWCDPDRLLAASGIPVRTNLTAARCAEGRLTFESEADPHPG